MSNTLKIFSTRGNIRETITENLPTTVGQLKQILREKRIDYEGMKLMHGERNIELQYDDTAIDYVDMAGTGNPTATIVLAPQTQKAG